MIRSVLLSFAAAVILFAPAQASEWDDSTAEPGPFADRPASEDAVRVERLQRSYPDDHYRNRWSDEGADNTLGPKKNPLTDTIMPGRYEWRGAQE